MIAQGIGERASSWLVEAAKLGQTAMRLPTTRVDNCGGLRHGSGLTNAEWANLFLLSSSKADFARKWACPTREVINGHGHPVLP